jgi:hypothetical protein
MLTIIVFLALVFPTFADDYRRSQLNLNQTSLSSLTNLPSHSTWEFNTPPNGNIRTSNDGWLTQNPLKTQSEVTNKNGKLIISVTGSNPKIDSDRFKINLNDRPTVAIRYRTTCKSNVGKFVLRGNKDESEWGAVTYGSGGDVWEVSGGSSDFFEEVFFNVVGDGGEGPWLNSLFLQGNLFCSPC